MLPERVHLGPFDLLAPIGKGGMGEVWRGVHRAQQVPVAVKVVLGHATREARFAAMFRSEVRHVARLDHPAIVRVLDHGEVSEEAAASSLGRLHAGSPWLAMEHASAGSLDRVDRVLGWEEVRELLLALLAGLGHAHARGVLHRDLKPGNVLIASPEDLRPGVKLTDFGLAHSTGLVLLPGAELASPWSSGIVGTPEFMSPEQIRGVEREQGPWTDLYALGCLAWYVAVGSPPFTGSMPALVLREHLGSPVPPLPAGLDLPAGFEAWVRRLLEKDPVRRFRLAADAAWALRALDRRTPPTLSPARRPAAPDAATVDATWSWLDEAAVLARLEDDDPTTEEMPLAALAPMPETWRTERPEPPSMRLVGAGLGLWGVRTLPLTGRESERDALWSALARVRALGQAGVVLLRGSAGQGKSVLASWLVERAQETGAGQGLVAEHGPIPVPAHGLGRMAARWLRVIGLGPDDAARSIERALRARGATHAYEWLGIARVVAGDPTLGREERDLIVTRLVARLCVERPVVLVLEDVQWSLDALSLVRHLLAQAGTMHLPVLVVLTCRDEALAEREAERAALEDLATVHGVTSLAVGPLAGGEVAALVGEMLGLEEGPARMVRERSGGNPLFAVQLVGDWVRRGVLEVGVTGFRLRRGEQAPIPDDIHGLWQTRLEQALDGVSGALEPLRIAAALGAHVDRAEWAEACAHAGEAVPEKLEEALLSAQLAEPTEQGWKFVHGMLRESVERGARAAGRWEAHNRACAEMVRARPPARGLAERLGQHLVAAGAYPESLAPLLDGAEECLRTSHYRRAQDLLDLREGVLDRLAVPESDPRRGAGQVAYVRVLLPCGELAAAEARAVRTAEAARRHEWVRVLPEALRHRAVIVQKRGDLGLAEALLLQAEGMARRAGAEDEVARALLHRAVVLRVRGDNAAAMELLDASRVAFVSLADDRGLAQCLSEQAAVRTAAGQSEEAEADNREAEVLYLKIGDQYGTACCANALGDLLRRRGDAPGAEDAYRRALEQCDRIGLQSRIVPLANLGLTVLERRDFLLAGDLLRTALQLADRASRRTFQCYAHVALLACAASAGDWDAWDTHVARATVLLDETGLADRDLAWPAELGAQLAADRGQAARAAQARSIASRQWRALGDAARAARVEAEPHTR